MGEPAFGVLFLFPANFLLPPSPGAPTAMMRQNHSSPARGRNKTLVNSNAESAGGTICKYVTTPDNTHGHRDILLSLKSDDVESVTSRDDAGNTGGCHAAGYDGTTTQQQHTKVMEIAAAFETIHRISGSTEEEVIEVPEVPSVWYGHLALLTA
ncbi:uncharacterized protein BCR38DRAFT_414677 [Pseudomassariella vexata]|uniref:Uncharacterized protein n=1 Tax=Pseudomassariella vexata TaxID=1141098 RepID=A0A1Y2DAI5_9PEZI|nr:uncharacterized protein BCR38DRAFT_414677 [Pseudomassariella vexata]ORY56164.1 hypothetical protein BCR38DRAFT_414677 [Pseudomassariella vexata]